MTERITTYHCANCGSESCGYDAYSTFDPVTQEWVLAANFDAAWCPECGEDADPQPVEITSPEEIEHILVERRRRRLAGLSEKMFRILCDGLPLIIEANEALKGNDTLHALRERIEALIGEATSA